VITEQLSIEDVLAAMSTEDIQGFICHGLRLLKADPTGVGAAVIQQLANLYPDGLHCFLV